MKKKTRLAFALAVLTATAAAQRTIRVPGDAPSIEAAVQMASAGDRVLLAASLYVPTGNGIVIDKALTMETESLDSRASIEMWAPLTEGIKVTRLGGGRLVLRNIDIGPPPDTIKGAGANKMPLLITLDPADHGEVLLDSVTTQGFKVFANANARCPGAETKSGPRVRLHIRNCRFVGASGNVNWYATCDSALHGDYGASIQADGPTLIEGSTFVGGPGTNTLANMLCSSTGGTGGAALLSGADLALVKCVLEDGRGGDSKVPVNYQGLARGGIGGRSSLRGDLFEVAHRPGRDGVVLRGNQVGPPDLPASELGRPRDLLVDWRQYWPGTPFDVTGAAPYLNDGYMLLLLGGLDDIALGELGHLYLNPPVILGVFPPSGASGWSQFRVPVPREVPIQMTVLFQGVVFQASKNRGWLTNPASVTFFP